MTKTTQPQEPDTTDAHTGVGSLRVLRPSLLRTSLLGGVSAFCLLAALAQPASAQSWKRVGTVTTLTNNQLCRTDGTNIICDTATPTLSGNNVAIGTTTVTSGVALDLGFNSTALNSSLLLPIGTTGTRPTTGVNGMLRYNSTTPAIEAYINGAWNSLAASGSAAVTLGTSLTSLNPTKSGDTTTGLYSDAAGTVEIASAGAQTFSSNSTYTLIPVGFVGIGTATPSSPLTIVVSNPSSSIAKYENTATNGYSSFDLYNNAGGLAFSFGHGNSATGGIFQNTNYMNADDGNPIVLIMNNAEAMRIGTTRNIGIGSTLPAVSLDISQKNDAVALPVGTTGQRPTGANGMVRYNSTIASLEGYVNGAWSSLLTSGAGSGSLTLGTATSAANPQVSGDATTGLYTSGAGHVDVVSVGSQIIDWSSAGENIVKGSLDIAGVNGVSFPQDYTTDASIAIGSSALAYQTIGTTATQGNTAIGYQTMQSASMTTAATGNTAVGYKAMSADTSGSGNVAVGNNALGSNTTGSGSVAIGGNALSGNNSGQSVGIGWEAGNGGGSGIYIGYNAGLHTTGGSNIVMGNQSMGASGDSGTSNIVIGNATVNNTTTGSHNIMLGTGITAGTSFSGSYNIVVGENGLYSATSATGNSTLGENAGYALTTGANNVAIGSSVAGKTLATGSNNILIGTSAAVDTPASGTNNFLNIANVIYGTSIGTQGQGSIGIGTASPSFALDVESGTSATFAQFGNSYPVYLFDNTASAPYASGIGFNLYTSTKAGTFYYGKTATTGYGAGISLLEGNTTGGLGFLVTSTQGATGAAATVTTAMTIAPTGDVGIGTTAPAVSLDLSQETDAVSMPAGTTGQRPVTGVNGMLRYNSTIPALEAYINGAWNALAASGSAAVTLGTSLTALNPTKSGDTTTGLYSDAAGTVEIASAGAKSFSTNSTYTNIPVGNVGIGTTFPITPLNVKQTNITVGTAGMPSYVENMYGATFYDNASNLTQAIAAPTADTYAYTYNTAITGTLDIPLSNSFSVESGAALHAVATNESTTASNGVINSVQADFVNTGSLSGASGFSASVENDDTVGGLSGGYFDVDQVTGTAYSLNGVSTWMELDGGTITGGLTSMDAEGGVYGGAVTGGYYGLYVESQIGSGSVDDRYGIFIADGGGASSITGSDFGLYQESTTAVNYFGGKIGIGSISPTVSIDASQQTDAISLPSGVTSNRPTGVNGMIRYNATIPALEAYINGAWNALAASGSAAVTLGTSLTALNPTKSGDTTTGLYSDATGTVEIASAGTKSFSSSAATTTIPVGSVGIGTASPKFALDVETGTADTFAQIGNSYPVYLFDGTPATPETGIGFNLYEGATNGSFYYGQNSLSSYGGYITVEPMNGTMFFGTTTAGGSFNSLATTQTDMVITAAGKIGLGTTSPTYDLSFGGAAAREIWMERATSGAGNNLTVQAGGALSGATDTAGGTLVLSSGIATGSQTSQIQFQTAPGAGTGTVDSAPSTAMVLQQVYSAGVGTNVRLGIGTATPATPIDISYVGNGSGVVRVTNTFNGGSALAGYNAVNNAGSSFGVFQTSGSYAGTYSIAPANAGLLVSSGGGGLALAASQSGAAIRFATGGYTSSNTRMIIGSTGLVGIGTTSPADSLDLSQETDAVSMPAGTTGQRPVTGVNGMLRYNSTIPALEAYINGAWNALASSGSAAVTLGTSLTSLNPTKSGDTTTGLYSDAAGTVEIASAGTKSFSSNSTYTNIPVGNVGIGTTSPQSPLHVFTTTTSTTGAVEFAASNTYPWYTHPAALTQVTISPAADATTGDLDGMAAVLDMPATNTNMSGTSMAINGILTNESTAANNLVYGNYTAGVNGSAFNTGTVYSLIGVSGSFESDSGTVGEAEAIYVYGGIYGGTVTEGVAGIQLNPYIGAGTVSNGLVGVWSNPAIGGGTLTGGLYGEYIEPDITGGSVDDRYGVYIADGGGASYITGSDFGLYQESTTAVNYFGGKIGIGSISPTVSIDASQQTDAISLPSGVTSNRPTGVNGMIRYNATIPALEAYINGAWSALASAGSTAVTLGTSLTSLNPTKSGDTTTGLYSDATGTVEIASAGAKSFSTNSTYTIVPTGSIGIGTATPRQTLQVAGNIGMNEYDELVSGYGYTDSTSSSYATLEMYDGGSGNTTLNNQGYGINLQTSGTTRLAILNGGNVGIGTATPASELSVYGGVAIGTSYAGTTAAPTNGAIIQGNVGIGQTAPIDVLEAQGGMRLGATATSVGQNTFYTTTSASVAVSQTTLPVTTSVGFPPSGRLFVGGISSGSNVEIMTYTGISGNTLTGVTRAQDGTTAQAFASGVIVSYALISSPIHPSSGVSSPSFFVTSSGVMSLGIPQFTGGVRYNNSAPALEIGSNVNVGGDSIVVGNGASATGGQSAAFGGTVAATGSNSFAANSNTTASGNYSSAFGFHNTAASYEDFAVGTYNVGNSSSATTVVATDPIFEVGIGTGTAGLAANAITVLKNGHVGIGSAIPTVSLDLSTETDAVSLPNGTLSQRPSTGVNGMLRYNSSTPAMEAYVNGSWTTLASSGGSATVTLGTSTGAANPQVSGDATTGFYTSAASHVDVTTAGTQVADFSTSGINITTGSLEIAGVNGISFPTDYTTDASIAIGSGTLASQPLGTTAVQGNIGIGYQVMKSASMTSATLDNVGIGYQALNITTGGHNVAIGAQALASNTTAGSNIALGNHALGSNSTNGGNIAIGYGAGYFSTGSNNLYMGYEAGFEQASGSDNTLIGGSSMGLNGPRANNSYNTALGYQSLLNDNSGNYNTVLGFQAGYDITIGTSNIMVGAFPTTAVGITTGTSNILLGYDVRPPSQTASNQLNIGNLIYATSIGTGAVASTGNVGIGSTTPQAKLDVYGAIDISGVNGLSFPTDYTTDASIAIGSGALLHMPLGTTTVQGNTAIGYLSMNSASMTAGATSNTAVGYLSMNSDTTGSGNVAIGYNALKANTTGSGSVAIGGNALNNNNAGQSVGIGWEAGNGGGSGVYIGYNAGVYTSGGNNIVVGGQTMSGSGTTGTYNIAIGQATVSTTTTGSHNIMLGSGITTGTSFSGSYNMVVGENGLHSASSATGNSILGENAGYTLTTGASNVAIGSAVASTTLATGSNNILLGTTSAVDTPASTTSNFLNIANVIYAINIGTQGQGNVAIGTTAPTAGTILDLGSNTTAANSSLLLPNGTTSTRPTTGANGMLRYNSTIPGLEAYINGGWTTLSASGGSASVTLGTATSAANPQVSGDATTGFYTSAASHVDVTAAGSQIVDWSSSGENIVTGSLNIAGVNGISFPSDYTTDASIAIGSSALAHQTIGTTAAQGNVAIGYQAISSTGLTTAAIANTAVGYQALKLNTSGYYNTAIGYGAASNVTGGSNNVDIGFSAGATGSYSTAVGSKVMTYGGGGNDTAMGYEAMVQASSNSGDNVAIGNYALGGAAFNDVGKYNVAVGYAALTAVNPTNYNEYDTALGFQAGHDVTSGLDNLMLGAYPTTGVGITTGSNNILIGYDVRPPSQTGNNQLNIGNLIYGTSIGTGASLSIGSVGIGTTAPTSLFSVGSTNGFTVDGTGDITLATSTAATSGTTQVAAPNIVLGSNYWTGSASAANNLTLTWTAPTVTGYNGLLLFAPSVTAGATNEVRFGFANTIVDSYNTYDSMGAAFGETYDTAYFGLRNAAGYSQGVVPAGLAYGFLALQDTGVVGTVQQSMTNAPPIFRNVLDDGSANERMGLGSSSPTDSLDISQHTDAISLPAGTLSQRPSTGVNGMLRYNSSTPAMEAYVNGSWTTLASSGGSATVTLGTSTGAANPQVSGDATTGFYTSAASHVDVTTAGSQIVDWSSTGENIVTGSLKLAGVNGLSFPQDYTPYASIAIGSGALAAQPLGTAAVQGNIAIGYNALKNMTAATTLNTVIGYNALASATTISSGGGSSVVIGANAFSGISGIWAGNDVYIGNGAGQNASDFGYSNVGIGPGVFGHMSGTAPSSNVAIGASAGNNVSGQKNVMIGASAVGSGTALSGSNNVIIGSGVADTGTVPTSASQDILIGVDYSTTVPLAATSNFMNIGNAIYGTNLYNTTNTTGVPQIAIGSGASSPTAGAVLDLSSNTTSANSSLLLPVGTTGTRPTTGVNGMLRYNTTIPSVEAYANGAWTSLGSGGGGSGNLGTSTSATNPQVSGDATTGLYSDAAGTVEISSAGTQTFRSNTLQTTIPVGNVGIGTTAPITQFSNTGTNIQDAAGGVGITGSSSIAWSAAASGYTEALLNSSTGSLAEGLLVSIAGTASANRILSLDSGGISRFIALGNGYVGIGTSIPAYPFQVGTNSSTGNGAYLSPAGVWVNASDARVKENVRPIAYGLDAVMKLKPVSYDMIGSHEKQVGFIAQDVLTVVPEVVGVPKNPAVEHYGLSYGNMVAVVTKAIQELKAMFDADHEDIAKLKAANDNQAKEIDDLKREFEDYKKSHK